MIHIPESDLVALLGENGENWLQGTWRDGGRKMCLHGAIRRCAPIAGDAHLIEQVALRKGWGTSWNDDASTTWADVRVRLAQLEVTDDDLADTFGPQWQAIVALVRRAAVLTADEADQFVAAWDAAWHAASYLEARARDAAWHAALGAAWGAARGAARAVAWAVARAATRDAARAGAPSAALDAARALVVRDLIGQHGFTQADYDTLTGPWALAIGPVHPDDVVIKP